MGEAENRQTVERVFEALTEGQVELFHAQFHEDSVIEFPQSGERIAGGESRRAVYRAFPGRPLVRRIVTFTVIVSDTLRRTSGPTLTL